jgi:uncharacterized protein (DUF58 family)
VLAVISDLYVEPRAAVDAVLRLRNAGNELLIMHVLDPAERDLPFRENGALADLETGAVQTLVPAAVRDEYRRRVAAHLAELERLARGAGVDYALFDTTMPLDHALARYLAGRQRLGRSRGSEAPMPLSLLAPWFLGGLALLAVPILVHLTRRDRTPPTAFPSLMFLGAVPHETVKRRRLRDWPLLLLRCLALALLAVAFARPFVDRAEARIAPPGGGGREVVILLDRSYSMGAGDRWARAAAAARRTVDGLGSGDLATVVAFDNAPRTLVAATADRARLAAALDSVRPGAGGTRYTPALALASQLLARSARRAREVVLVTDFQRSGWRADDEARLPAGVRLVPVDVGAAPPPNVAVGGVELARADEGGGGARETLAATARLTSTGGAAARDLTAVSR